VPSSEIVTTNVDKMQEDGKAKMSPDMHEGDKKCEEIRII
jgi:hypothetical protein